MQSKQRVHQYWTRPDDGSNLPEDYATTTAEAAARSRFLVALLERHTTPDASVLEIGCNAGRNLHFLYQAGYRNLSAIEISADAVNLLRNKFPSVAECTTIYNHPVEDCIRDLQTSSYDAVFTMAVLEHIHYDSEWVFSEIARISRRLVITFEDEQCVSWRHAPRNYKNVFGSLGLRQVHAERNTEEQGSHGAFMTRVFLKD